MYVVSSAIHVDLYDNMLSNLLIFNFVDIISTMQHVLFTCRCICNKFTDILSDLTSALI